MLRRDGAALDALALTPAGAHPMPFCWGQRYRAASLNHCANRPGICSTANAAGPGMRTNSPSEVAPGGPSSVSQVAEERMPPRFGFFGPFSGRALRRASLSPLSTSALRRSRKRPVDVEPLFLCFGHPRPARSLAWKEIVLSRLTAARPLRGGDRLARNLANSVWPERLHARQHQASHPADLVSSELEQRRFRAAHGPNAYGRHNAVPLFRRGVSIASRWDSCLRTALRGIGSMFELLLEASDNVSLDEVRASGATIQPSC